MQKIIFILFLVLGTSCIALAQSKKKKQKQKKETTDKGATYGENYMGSGYKYKKKVKYNNLDFDTKVDEYEARVKKNIKKKKKMAKEMEKPQYSDPSYFGHKRKPKKRKPGKRKFCKECEMVH